MFPFHPFFILILILSSIYIFIFYLNIPTDEIFRKTRMNGFETTFAFLIFIVYLDI